MVQRLTFRLIAILYIAFVFLTSAFFFLIALAIWLTTVLFDKRLWLLHRFTCLWASLYIRLMPPWSVSIKGKEHIDAKDTYIIVSNHQSLLDILVAFTLFTHFKWVSKAELFNIPLIGWNMSLNQYIKLRRGNNKSVKTMYKACENHLQHGSSIYLFPEGTRSESGKMREFKEGAFVLAKRLQKPILPIVINGSRTALPKSSFNFHGETHIEVTVLPPILPESFTEDSAKELAAQVRHLIEQRILLDWVVPGRVPRL
jgi:1-acyl-sn-glycerol-3-phosphate acyltransferase